MNALLAPDFIKTVNEQANALASAWSTAAEQFAERVTAEGGEAVLTIRRQQELFVDCVGNEYKQLALSAERWTAAAKAQGQAGISDIMGRYADKYAAKANALLDPLYSAETKIAGLVTETKLGVQAAESMFGGSLGKAIGPAYDAYQMMEGALEWGRTGESSSFGQAAMGVVVSSTAGAIFGGFAALLGAGALGVAIVAGVFAGIGSLLGPNVFDMANKWASEHAELWNSIFEKLGHLGEQISTAYRASRTFIERRDPLALDLDGDGLETTGIDGSRPTQFDHDGDGLRTGTGWLQGDDAFLALDRNNNGKIDNGSELFGVDTVLATGPNAGQTAANGFAALADLDSNHDGLFSALDKQYDSVRLWRDGNQDGLSQTDELTALSDAGITSINLASTATNIALPGGNVQSAAGTYTRSNGQTGRVGDFTTGASGNLDLAQNPFYSTFTDPLPLTAAAQTLPGLHGSGQVRDLREAASLDAALVTDINRMHGTTHTQMMPQVDTLITHWTATSTMPTSISDAAHKGYTLAYLPPGMTPDDYLALHQAGATATAADRLHTLQAQAAHLETLLGVLERFNGMPFVTVGDNAVTTGQGWVVNASAPSTDSASGVSGQPVTRYAFVNITAGQLSLLEQSYEKLKDSVYGGLVLQTRLKPYLDAVSLTIDESGIKLDFSGMEAANDFEWRKAG